MTTSHDETPAVTAFPDHEIIVPPNKLKKAVSKALPGRPEDDPVARAEAALAGLSHEFSTWMASECERLDRARRKIMTSGFSVAAHDELFRAAHDIRGGAETFGFPRAGEVADSLCRLIEHTPDTQRLPLALIDQHVDAIRAIIHRNTRGDSETNAAKLAGKLRHVTEEFLVHENRDRPEYLELIMSPTLAPGDANA